MQWLGCILTPLGALAPLLHCPAVRVKEQPETLFLEKREVGAPLVLSFGPL